MEFIAMLKIYHDDNSLSQRGNFITVMKNYHYDVNESL